MIHLFDLSAGISGTKVLTDKILRDRSPVKKGRKEAEAKDVPDSGAGYIEDKMVIHESRSCSNKQSSVTTPMKMLIAQEMMSKEMETWQQKPPTVIARLMGLDALTPKIQEKPNQLNPECLVHNSCTACGTIWNTSKQERIHHERLMPLGDRPFQSSHCSDHKSYKDAYEVRQQASSGISRKRCVEKNSIDEKMSLVRQKFMEAKRLATNQRLLHSKEFQEALEVLSSNRDIFLKILEEPNSLISSCMELELDDPSKPSQSNKKITVLKPSKAYDETKSDHGSESFSYKTRIMVLKPSREKLQGIPKPPERKLLFDKLRTDDEQRVVAKEMVQSMRESICSGYRMDETGVSPSVLSNGYIGDESSFNRSEDEYMEDEYDSEIATPISQQSWGYTSRFYSHTSKSQESSVIKEAKKRHSERWVTVKSNKINEEPRKEWSGTNTLGEMLAIRETNKEESNLMGASSCLSSNWNEIEKDDNFSLSLQRWKSIPASSSSVNNKVELDMEERPEPQVGKSDEMGKLKSGKPTTIKGRVSNLFSRTMKYTQENPFSSSNSEYHEGSSNTFEKFLTNKDFNSILDQDRDNQVMLSLEQCFYCEDACEKKKLEYSDPHSFLEPSMFSSLEQYLSCENEHSVPPSVLELPSLSSLDHYISSENACGNLDDSIPFSVFELPSRSIFSESFDSLSIGSQRTISRSTPIESVARSLSWDASTSSGRTTLNPLKQSNNFLQEDVEKHKRHMFVQSLMSSVGLDTTETLNTFLFKWHSLESPLNPALLENHLLEQKGKGQLCNEKRSNERFLFDCVNAALLDISSWRGKGVVLSVNLLRKSSREASASSTNSLTDDVLKRIDDLFSTDNRSLAIRCNSCFELDTIVRNEVSGGKEWSDMMGSEITQVGMIIETQVLDELVNEILEDFISSHLKPVVTYCN